MGIVRKDIITADRTVRANQAQINSLVAVATLGFWRISLPARVILRSAAGGAVAAVAARKQATKQAPRRGEALTADAFPFPRSRLTSENSRGNLLDSRATFLGLRKNIIARLDNRVQEGLSLEPLGVRLLGDPYLGVAVGGGRRRRAVSLDAGRRSTIFQMNHSKRAFSTGSLLSHPLPWLARSDNP